jgi:hypothetical protein
MAGMETNQLTIQGGDPSCVGEVLMEPLDAAAGLCRMALGLRVGRRALRAPRRVSTEAGRRSLPDAD